jgi:hypothetical protein
MRSQCRWLSCPEYLAHRFLCVDHTHIVEHLPAKEI